jgi:hypothetical protein
MKADELSEVEAILSDLIAMYQAVVPATIIAELEVLRCRFNRAWVDAVRREVSGETRVSPDRDSHSAA